MIWLLQLRVAVVEIEKLVAEARKIFRYSSLADSDHGVFFFGEKKGTYAAGICYQATAGKD
jgi:hypothetical protein